MENENLKAIVGLVLAIVLVVVMGYILKLTNKIIVAYFSFIDSTYSLTLLFSFFLLVTFSLLI
jgi:hypothetical protein